MQKFMIISTQRSGSSFLVTTLASHSRIECFRELLLEENEYPNSYTTFRRASLRNRFLHLFARQKLMDAFLNNLYTDQAGVDALGFKIMYSQVKRLPEAIAWAKQHQVKVIHLIRTNTLKKRVSRIVQRQRNLAHSRVEVAPIRITVETENLEAKLSEIERETDVYGAQFREAFTEPGYMEVSYESLMAHRDEVLNRILDFLGVVAEPELGTDLVKVNPDELAKVIENYEAVKATLTGTAFEHCLDGMSPKYLM